MDLKMPRLTRLAFLLAACALAAGCAAPQESAGGDAADDGLGTPSGGLDDDDFSDEAGEAGDVSPTLPGFDPDAGSGAEGNETTTAG